MADLNDPTSLQKKKTKKKKKKNGGKTEPEGQEPTKEEQEKQPQQATDRDETIIRTTKCSYCGKNVRQLLRGFKNPENVNHGPVVCETCLKTISQRKEDYRGLMYMENTEKGGGGSMGYRQSRKPPVNETLCNCVACVSKRDNTVTPDVERDAHITQSYWMEIRHIVRCIYRENMSLSATNTRNNIGSEKMRSIVRKLCCRDPHQFFQRLETLAREYLLEVKVRLLEQLSCGFNSPQLAIEFIQMLLDEYSALCSALPSLLYLLEPLEETEYIQRLGVTIELVNKNIFRELIFAESFMSSNLPLIIAQLRLASLSSDPFHRSTADALSQRYNSLDDEMDMIGNVWNTAKDQLKQQQEEFKKREERRAHIEKILSDGESFKRQTKRDQQQSPTQEVYTTTTPVQVSSEKMKEDPSSTDNTPLIHSHDVTNHKIHHPTSTQSFTPPITDSPKQKTTSLSVFHHSTDLLDGGGGGGEEGDEDTWLSKEQVAEWSKILFKCIKPIGDPEFRITDNIATHTITLKIDMTAIDLRHAESVCTLEQVKKYEELGMRREEIAEVALKLNAIKHLGINLRIDDLFDEHGFVIVDGNDYHEDRDDAVYFVEEGKNSVKGKEKLMEEEMSRSGLVDLQKEKEKVIHREENEVGEGRETDLLQSMTMKIRFMKSVADEDMRDRLMSDSEQVMFESCDQVQMKLTQLELNTMRLMCTNKCLDLASNLGIRKCKTSDCSKSDEDFVHTDAHQPFVGLLLEQGKQDKQVEQSKKEKDTTTVSPTIATVTNEDDSKNGNKPPSNTVSKKEPSEKSTVLKAPEQVTTRKEPGGSDNSGSNVSPVVPTTICIPSKTQSCQCFACIGAVAAQITEGSYRPLNPVDPSGSKLSIKGMMANKLSDDVRRGGTSSEHLEDKLSTKSASNKAEHLWQNWMSTTEMTQPSYQESNGSSLDSTSETNQLQPPSTDTGADQQSSSASNGNDITGSSNNTTDHALSQSGSNSTTSSPHPDGGNATTTTTCMAEDHVHHSGAHKGNSGNGPVKRYCPCCYCELFGQSSQTVPTSHNYTKQRDKMRQKLEKKRKQEHIHCRHQHAHHHHHHHHEEPRPHSPVEIHQDHQHHYHHHHHHHHPPPPPQQQQQQQQQQLQQPPSQHHHHHHQPLPTPSPPPPTSSPSHPPPVTAAAAAPPTATVVAPPPQKKEEKSLDEILMFIEGKDFNGSNSELSGSSNSSKSKKKKKAKKKSDQETPLPNGHVVTNPAGNPAANHTSTGTTASDNKKNRKEDTKHSATATQQNGGPPQKKGSSSQIPVSQSTAKANTKVNSPKQSHKKSSRTSGQSNGQAKALSGKGDVKHSQDSNSFSDVDEDYDQELEEFKKLCFSSVPVESRKKIHVSLNMQDILSKIK